MQMSQIIRDLPAAVTEKVHSQLQTNGKVPTLFVFCINPSLVIVYQSHIMRVLCKYDRSCCDTPALPALRVFTRPDALFSFSLRLGTRVAPDGFRPVKTSCCN